LNGELVNYENISCTRKVEKKNIMHNKLKKEKKQAKSGKKSTNTSEKKSIKENCPVPIPCSKIKWNIP